jgi:hypothetical protein
MCDLQFSLARTLRADSFRALGWLWGGFGVALGEL